MKKKKIEHYSDKEALEFHNTNKSGKIEIISSKPMTSKRDLALAYSPGVAAPVKAIADNPDLAYAIDRQVIMPTIVTHTKDHLNDHVKQVCEEAFDLKLSNLHIYSNVMAESYIFKSHKDAHSIMLVQCIGMSEYHFEDGSCHQLQPGDGLYIPRGIYHAPRVFGPRVTFSYNWHYLR